MSWTDFYVSGHRILSSSWRPICWSTRTSLSDGSVHDPQYSVNHILTLEFLITYYVTVTVDSAPSLGVYYFCCCWLCLCVCLSVCTNINSFLFLDGIEPFLGHQFSMTKTTKRCSSIFDLGPVTPNICTVGHWVSQTMWVNNIWDRLGVQSPTGLHI